MKTSDLGQGEGAGSGAVVCLVANRRDHFARPAHSEMEKRNILDFLHFTFPILLRVCGHQKDSSLIFIF